MGETVLVPPKRRKVRCPNCRGILAEPGSGIYECPFCSILLQAKETPPDFLAEPPTKPTTDDDQGLQGSQQGPGLEAISTSGNVPTRQQSQERFIDNCETDASGDGNVKLPEWSLLPVGNGSVKNTPKSELQREVDTGRDESASTGDADVLASNTGTAIAEEGVAARVRRFSNDGGIGDSATGSGGEKSEEEHSLPDHMNESREERSCSDRMDESQEKSQEEHLLSDHMNEQRASSSGDDNLTSHMPSENAESRSEPNGREGERRLVGDCESVEGKDRKDCHLQQGEGVEHLSQSEIIRYNHCDPSFNDRSLALQSTNPLPSNKRSRSLSSASSGCVSNLSDDLTDKRPSSCDEKSIDSSKQANISDLLFQLQISSPNVPSDVPPAPHRLEWEGADLEDEEIPWQNSIGATAIASIGAVTESVSDALIGIERRDQVESVDGDRHCQKPSSINGTLSIGLQDIAEAPTKFLQAQREHGVPGIGSLADLVGLADLKGVNAEETKGDSDGYLGSLSYQVNGHKAVLYTDFGEEAPSSLLAGARHPSKLKAGSSLKGASTSSTLVLGTEADGCDVESCRRTSPEAIKLTHSVGNIQQGGDSITIMARENTVAFGGSHHACQMILKKQISERASDPSCHQQNGFLQDDQDHRRAASTRGFTTQRDAGKCSLAQNTEAECEGTRSASEHSNSSNCSVVDSFTARQQLKRSYPSETTRSGNREGTVANMFDSRVHHERNHSSEETHLQSEHFTRYTSQEPLKNAHYEGHLVSRSTRVSGGSSNMHFSHGQGSLMLVDEHKPWSQKQNIMEHGGNYSGPFLSDSCRFPPASMQPCGYSRYSNGSDSFARGLSFQCQHLPSHSCPLPVAMPGQAFIHCGCHSVAPVCMACIHGHRSDLRQLSMPPQCFCCNQALPIAHQHGLWNSHQAHQIQPSEQGASVAHYPSPCLPSRTVHMHDTVNAMERPPVASARKSKLYPPIPRGNAAPYVICKGCEEILKVPTDIPLSDSTTQKLRCGDCRKVAKFSTLQGNHGAGNNLALHPRTTVASAKTSHLVQYPEQSRPLPVSNVAQTMEPSYHQDLYPGALAPYEQGSFDSQRQISAAVRTKSRPSSLDETVREGASFGSQDEFFFRSLSRQDCEFDSSRMFFSGFKAASSTPGASNYPGEVSREGNGISLQASVDEKDEGLDFGAPRMSDGESLDQRSPDSRMRSPENMQRFQSRDQNWRMQNSDGDDEAIRKTENVLLEVKKRSIAHGKRPTQTLLTLLNQESSKFEINVEEIVPFDESRSASASSSPLHDHVTNEMPAGTQDKVRSRPTKLTSAGFLRKGQRSVACMLRTSIKRFQRESH